MASDYRVYTSTNTNIHITEFKQLFYLLICNEKALLAYTKFQFTIYIERYCSNTPLL